MKPLLFAVPLGVALAACWTPAAVADDDWEDVREEIEDAAEEAADEWEDHIEDLADDDDDDHWRARRYTLRYDRDRYDDDVDIEVRVGPRGYRTYEYETYPGYSSYEYRYRPDGNRYSYEERRYRGYEPRYEEERRYSYQPNTYRYEYGYDEPHTYTSRSYDYSDRTEYGGYGNPPWSERPDYRYEYDRDDDWGRGSSYRSSRTYQPYDDDRVYRETYRERRTYRYDSDDDWDDDRWDDDWDD